MARINIPPLTRSSLLVCLCLSVLSGALRYRAWMQSQSAGDTPDTQFFTVPFLAVVPALSITYPWTFVSATLVETNIFTLTITLATLFYGGKYLERAWGSSEFGKFLLVVAVVPNFLAFLFYIAWFAATGNVVRSFTTICGGIALQAGFLVAFKQLVPEHTVTLFKGLVKIRVKHFPALFLLANTLSGPLFGTDVAAVLAWLGFFSSWTYLRFYKRSFPDLGSAQSPTLKGDASEIFEIAYFFPDPLHRPISALSNAVYAVLVAVNLCTPFSAADVSASNSQAQARDGQSVNSMFGGGRSGGGTVRAEAERRRALALKALDQQLHAAASNKNNSSNHGNGGNVGGSAGPSVLGETTLDTSFELREAQKQ